MVLQWLFYAKSQLSSTAPPERTEEDRQHQLVWTKT